jgi:hypothetical protein
MEDSWATGAECQRFCGQQSTVVWLACYEALGIREGGDFASSFKDRMFVLEATI